MTNNKTYKSIEIYSQGLTAGTMSEGAERELDRIVENDRNGYGINVFVFYIRSENDEQWEELFSYDNKNSSADFSRRAKEVLTAETINLPHLQLWKGGISPEGNPLLRATGILICLQRGEAAYGES